MKEKKQLIKLLNEWDPIGIYPMLGGPQDEYDCFVQPIVAQLKKGKTHEEIIKFLTNYLKEHVGIEAYLPNLEIFVEKLFQWWNQSLKHQLN